MFPEGYPNIDPHFTPKTRPEEILPFRAGFATIAAAAEKRLGVRVPIIPGGFRYAKTDRWIARLNLGAPAYLEDFPSRRLLVSHMERQIAELSGSWRVINHVQTIARRGEEAATGCTATIPPPRP